MAGVVRLVRRKRASERPFQPEGGGLRGRATLLRVRRKVRGLTPRRHQTYKWKRGDYDRPRPAFAQVEADLGPIDVGRRQRREFTENAALPQDDARADGKRWSTQRPASSTPSHGSDRHAERQVRPRDRDLVDQRCRSGNSVRCGTLCRNQVGPGSGHVEKPRRRKARAEGITAMRSAPATSPRNGSWIPRRCAPRSFRGHPGGRLGRPRRLRVCVVFLARSSRASFNG